MAKVKIPNTQAVRALKEKGVSFSLHPYKYQQRGGTSSAANALKIDEHLVVKTLVMEKEDGEPFLVLMHGDKKVSTRSLARALDVKHVRPCDPQKANRCTGYLVGGISPFGIRKPLKVYVETSILNLPKIYINAGKRGLLAALAASDLKMLLEPIPVHAAL